MPRNHASGLHDADQGASHERNGESTIDQSEVDRFSAMAAEWWSPTGKFKPLHKFNPVRLAYIRDRACENFDRNPKSSRPLEGLRVLDIGCGGGLLSEPMARMAAEVIGADPSERISALPRHMRKPPGFLSIIGR